MAGHARAQYAPRHARDHGRQASQRSTARIRIAREKLDVLSVVLVAGVVLAGALILMSL